MCRGRMLSCWITLHCCLGDHCMQHDMRYQQKRLAKSVSTKPSWPSQPSAASPCVLLSVLSKDISLCHGYSSAAFLDFPILNMPSTNCSTGGPDYFTGATKLLKKAEMMGIQSDSQKSQLRDSTYSRLALQGRRRFSPFLLCFTEIHPFQYL